MLKSREYVNKVLVGDSHEILKELPDKIFQTCVTSPPYWGLRDYGTSSWKSGDSDCDHIEQAHGMSDKNTLGRGGHLPDTNQGNKAGRLQYKDVCAKCGAKRIDRQIGLEDSIEKYVEEIVGIFREVKRTLRDDGTLWLNLGDSYNSSPPPSGKSFRRDRKRVLPTSKSKRIPRGSGRYGGGNVRSATLKPKDLCGIPWRVAFALQADGWYLRCDIIWSKKNPMPESVTDRPTKAHEYIFLMSKKPRYYYDAEAIREKIKWENEGRMAAPKMGADRPKFGARDQNIKQYEEIKGANKRSVWEITTQPYKEAHFATFPEALVNPCILAGTPEVGCCVACGAPRKRIVEASGGTIGEGWNDHKNDLSEGFRTPHKTKDGSYHRETTGWKSGCSCKAEARPALVLDPFGGSGTVGYRAKQMGRAFTLIELNPEYAKMAERRMIQEVLL